MIRTATLSLFFLLTLGVHAQCSVSFTSDTTTIYLGYTPLSCTTLAPLVTGLMPYQYNWSSGDTTMNIIVCDTASSWYTVMLTDDTLCTSIDSIFVQVIDVRCGNNPNNQKVLVCHVPPGNPANEHTICISENGVPAHLAHGCYLGPCDSDTSQFAPAPNNLQVIVTPNPLVEDGYIEVMSTRTQVIEYALFDPMGRRLYTSVPLDIAADVPNAFPISLSNIKTESNVLLLQVTAADGSRVVSRVLR